MEKEQNTNSDKQNKEADDKIKEEQNNDESNNCMLDQYHYNWIYISIITILLLICLLKHQH